MRKKCNLDWSILQFYSRLSPQNILIENSLRFGMSTLVIYYKKRLFFGNICLFLFSEKVIFDSPESALNEPFLGIKKKKMKKNDSVHFDRSHHTNSDGYHHRVHECVWVLIYFFAPFPCDCTLNRLFMCMIRDSNVLFII